MRLIITGTGRCGTAFAARVFTSLGVQTTHEELFRPSTITAAGNAKKEWTDILRGEPWIGESSWMAMKALGRLRSEYQDDLVVVHLIRNREACIDSLLHRTQAFEHPHLPPLNVYSKLLRRWFPEAWEIQIPRDRAAYLVDERNRLIAPHADVTMYLERPLPGLYEALERLEERRDMALVSAVVKFWGSRRPNHG